MAPWGFLWQGGHGRTVTLIWQTARPSLSRHRSLCVRPVLKLVDALVKEVEVLKVVHTHRHTQTHTGGTHTGGGRGRFTSLSLLLLLSLSLCLSVFLCFLSSAGIPTQ